MSKPGDPGVFRSLRAAPADRPCGAGHHAASNAEPRSGARRSHSGGNGHGAVHLPRRGAITPGGRRAADRRVLHRVPKPFSEGPSAIFSFSALIASHLHQNDRNCRSFRIGNSWIEGTSEISDFVYHCTRTVFVVRAHYVSKPPHKLKIQGYFPCDWCELLERTHRRSLQTWRLVRRLWFTRGRNSDDSLRGLIVWHPASQ
jgi:hypothetical protein